MDEINCYIQQLGSEDKDISCSAEQSLIGMGSIAVEPLLQALNSEDPQTRYRAAYILGKIRDPRAFDTLLRATQDSDPAVRYDAVMALGDLGNSRAIGPLLQILLGDEELDSPAAMALVKIGSPAVEPIIGLLSDPNPQVRELAASILGGIGDTRAIEPLTRLAHDSDEWVRIRVVEALAELGGDRAVAVLKSMLNDPHEHVVEVAQYWLKEIGGSASG